MKKIYLSLLAFCLPMSLQAATIAEVKQAVTETLKQVNQRIQVEAVEKTALDSLYKVILDSGEELYTDSKATHFIVGDMIAYRQGHGLVNLSREQEEKQRAKDNVVRKDKLASLSEADMVVFPALGEKKAVITVFTDVDCGYCRKLHQDVPELNKHGVQINYLAFPRNGLNSNAYQQMASIWCSGDEGQKRKAMDKAKQGQHLAKLECENPVKEQYQLGRQFGVTGTPAMVMDDGSLIPGYIEADRLLRSMGLK